MSENGDRYCGRVGYHGLEEISERAAKIVAKSRTRLAVSLSKDGAVTVEPADAVMFSELVGVFDKKPGLFNLWKAIEESLRHCVDERKIVGGYKQKHIVRNFRKAA